MKGIPLTAPDLTSGQLALTLQPTTTDQQAVVRDWTTTAVSRIRFTEYSE